jgi:hypothetical protein
MTTMTLQPYLDDLERRLDSTVEDRLEHEWKGFLEGHFTGDIFSPRRSRVSPPGLPWPTLSINAAFDDPERMVLRELAGCSAVLANGGGAMLNVRCNYSTAILPSLFGTELFTMEEHMNTLPTASPLDGGGLDPMRQLLDRGIPEVRTGLGARVMDTAALFREVFQHHPNIRRHVHLYHPDLQGPMDVTELLWGSALFYDIVDEPDLVSQVLTRVTDTYGRFMHAWEALIPSDPTHNVHWGLLHRGRLMLRDDSAMNFSPEMFDRFIRPYDARLLGEFGGGAIHFCGRGDHYIASASTMPGLFAIQLSQPECNDMEQIYRHTVDKGIRLLGLNRTAAEAALAAGRQLHGLVHCW